MTDVRIESVGEPVFTPDEINRGLEDGTLYTEKPWYHRLLQWFRPKKRYRLIRVDDVLWIVGVALPLATIDWPGCYCPKAEGGV
jgi:hypothetical protein